MEPIQARKVSLWLFGLGAFACWVSVNCEGKAHIILGVIGLAMIVVAEVIWHKFFKCPHCGRYLFRNMGDYCQHCGKSLWEKP